jgi:N-methylhydantoinase A
VKPRRPVAAADIHEIPERLDAAGATVTPLDEAAVRTAARAIRARGIAAVAICFLHSYANPAHERRARELLLEEHPEAMVSISSDVLPVFREFERSMATILNVYVMPLVATYVARLDAELRRIGVDAPLLLMKSSGGVTGTATIRREPIQTALSGPAAGIVGAVHEAGLAGFRDIITVDIGGTSADICLIRDGRPGMTTRSHVGAWPMTLPMVDIHTIGAGGGSIARVTEAGTLVVGPESAGARPGPVCYGRGGTEPTVTDAHLVLGHLPERLLAGAMRIDRAAAVAAIEQRIARPLGMSLSDAALGILQVVNNNMLGAIRVVSVERGLDPRDFALLPFGGAGPIHGSALARLLGSRTVLVPQLPGVLSAIGLTVSSLRNEFARTCLQRLPEVDLGAMAEGFAGLEAEAAAWLAEERVPESDRALEWEAAVRYRHQGFELTVPWPERRVDAASIEALVARFHATHAQLYSFAQEDTPVEIVTLRVTAIGRTEVPQRLPLPAGRAPTDCILAEQEIFVDGRMRPCPVYDRAALAPGSIVTGPAILVQLDTTTLLEPGDRAEVHPHGGLVVSVGD